MAALVAAVLTLSKLYLPFYVGVHGYNSTGLWGTQRRKRIHLGWSVVS